MDFKFDMATLKRLTNPQAADDLNAFLEKLPQTAGQTALIAAGIAWMMGATIGLYTAIELKALTELRNKLRDAKAVVPIVPRVKDVPVSQQEVKDFAADLAQTYPSLSIKQQGASIQIMGKTTALFGTFREAIGHVQNGGELWRVSTEKLCVGRECSQNQLGILLKINKVSIDKPK